MTQYYTLSELEDLLSIDQLSDRLKACWGGDNGPTFNVSGQSGQFDKSQNFVSYVENVGFRYMGNGSAFRLSIEQAGCKTTLTFCWPIRQSIDNAEYGVRDITLLGHQQHPWIVKDEAYQRAFISMMRTANEGGPIDVMRTANTLRKLQRQVTQRALQDISLDELREQKDTLQDGVIMPRLFAFAVTGLTGFVTEHLATRGEFLTLDDLMHTHDSFKLCDVLYINEALSDAFPVTGWKNKLDELRTISEAISDSYIEELPIAEIMALRTSKRSYPHLRP